MLWSILKWGLPALAFVAVAGAFTRKTFHVETVIPATPEQVWAVLIDTKAYSEWNPVFVSVEGTYAQGAKLQNKVRDPKGNILEMTATVIALNPERELRQYGGIPGVITFDHRWLLEPVEGGTKVIQHEVDRGFYLWFWNSNWIEPAYRSVNDALARELAK
ncbi:SRPBCC domain-containing protein [Shimia sp. R9_1]|uniref:SRPBCC domain-containing protein n=1 Tax=Shimia sp. R9_1 TaxID=2821111 RepID=UPI001ADA9B9E|nr:SRPBCC domain-containing protein [Shimia sp. R9_1]MBO9407849.1 SRPBCC domain-containing protein [Shimia sp. R9_1]